MINVAIIGVSGYTGLEFVKILHAHPKFNINYIGASQDGLIDLIHPSLKKVFCKDVKQTNAKEVAKHASLAFLALPHKTAMNFAKQLLELGIKVVDLSADYRLNLQNYESFYCPHEDKDNLKYAVYGLSDYFKEDIKKANLVANPGCYPTASLLALLPFSKILDKNSEIFIDAKSGVSGAGKNLSYNTHFVNIHENIFTYNPLVHRHEIEIKEKVSFFANHDFEVIFVPHLIPVTRGMLVSIYIKLSQEIDAFEILQNAYKNNKFIRLRHEPVCIKNTVGTHFCDIFVKQRKKVVFLSSSIDNLLRGASSSAVVNANLMSGYDEFLGIPNIAYAP